MSTLSDPQATRPATNRCSRLHAVAAHNDVDRFNWKDTINQT